MLEEKRKFLGLNHEEVANLAGISRPYYTNIEAGRKIPSLAVAKKIADALGTDVNSIFFNDDVPKRNSA